MGKLYVEKPLVVEAVEFTGKNDGEIAAFVGFQGFDPEDDRPTWVVHTGSGNTVTVEVGDFILRERGSLTVRTRLDFFGQFVPYKD